MAKSAALKLILAALCGITAFTLIMTAGGGSTPSSDFVVVDDLNSDILEVVQQYPTDGSYPAMPPAEINATMGVTRDLYYGGKRVVRGDPHRRSYCSGLMLEVYLGAAERWAEKNGYSGWLLPGVSTDNFAQFRRDFYGVDGNPLTFVAALEKRGLGKVLPDLEEARPGDLVQFWRTSGNGHTCVFKSWRRDSAGRINGLEYWSVQHATQGIGHNVENVGYGVGGIDPARIHIIRAFPPSPA